MPYSTPTDTVVAPIAFPSQGRPGHRRSFSHITALDYTSTSSSPSVGSLPRRRPTASAPPVFAAHAAPHSPHKATFQLGRDDDDDDNSSDEAKKTQAQQRSRAPADDDGRMLPPLRLKMKHGSFSGATHRGSLPPQIALHPASPGAVPFPRSSPSPSPSPSPQPSESESNVPFPHTRTTSDHGTLSPSAEGARLLRPSVSRTFSSPILLSNGKPLKSSLKSSSSSPNIPFPPQSLVPSIMFPDLHRHQRHQRARSAPSTPHLETVEFGSSESSSPSPPSLDSPSEPPSPTMPQKNVHFPSQEEGGLATVRVFNRSAKPASVSRLGEDTETETEGESSAATNSWSGLGWNTWGMRSAKNFPRLAGSQSVGWGSARGSPLSRQEEKILEVDSENSTPVPARGAEKGFGNVYLESVGFIREVPKNPTPRHPLVLAGTLLVRNVTYQKSVAVRFTMDDWHTTNDVLATYEKSFGALPARFVLGAAGALSADASAASTSTPSSTSSPTDTRVCSPYAIDSPDDVPVRPGEAPAWDRFRFEIKLEDFAGVLEGRTMWLVGRYSASGAGLEAMGAGGEEWWDNNGGMNYRVGFRRREVVEERKRGVVFSAPSVYPATTRPTATLPVTKSYPAPPQISASVSLPTSFEEHKQQQQQAQPVQQPMQPPQPTQQQDLPKQEPAHIEQHLPHQAAVAQSTLARLRKLNLRNYAAPASYVSPTGATPSAVAGETPAIDNNPGATQRTLSTSSTDSSTSSIDSMDSLSTASSTTSADSTPLLTPTHDPAQAKVYVHQGPRHDLDIDVLGKEASMSLQRGGHPPNAVDEDGHTTDEAATPTPTPRTTRWGAGAKEFAAAVSGAGAGVFKLRLGSGASPGVSRSATPTQASLNNSTSTLNLNTTTLDKAAAMDISSRRRGAMDDASRNVGIGSPSEMGTSPPFSAMADMLSENPGGVAAAPRPLTSAASVLSPTTEAAAVSPSARHGHHLYWPWGSFKTAATAEKEKEKVHEDDKEYSSPPPQQGHEEGRELKTPPLSAPVASLLRDIKEKNAAPADPTSNFSDQSKLYSGNASPSPSYLSYPSSSSPATLPHRRRTAHSSVSGGGNTSGSPSSSGSESGRKSHHRRIGSGGSGSSSPLPSSASLPSQGLSPLSSLPLPMSPSNSMVWGMRPGSPRPGSPRPGSPRPAGVAGSNGGLSGMRSPLRMSPVHSFSDLTAAAVAVAGTSGISSHIGSASIGGGSSTTESGSATSSSSSPPTSPAAQDDPLYQAFVRQWCFAQAPGPTVGASVANAGAGTPGGLAAGASVPMAMSGVEMGVGEPRLAVK